ncbi:MAG: hypothetical protein JNK89_03440, partial [Saprospiraceae bacterium]|nr:hypothetical protein [Saprospiraceae bacterium]
ATLIRQVLLGNPAANNIFNTAWRFVPASYSLGLPPWGFPEQISLTGVNSNQSGLDFTGIKLGDLVATFADPASFAGGGRAPWQWRIADQTLESQGPLIVTVQAAAFDNLAALQCAFEYDTDRLRLDTLEILTALPLTPMDFGLLTDGQARLAWATNNQGVQVAPNAGVFRFQFEVLEAGGTLATAIWLNDSILAGEAYNSAFQPSAVELEFYSSSSTAGPGGVPGLDLYQNRPNPFTGATTIGFHLPAAAEAQLRVLDLSGRLLWQTRGNYPAGYSAETVQILTGSGLLVYELVTPWGVLTRKMVRVE